VTRSRHWLWPLKNTKPLHFFFFCTFIGDLFTKRRKRKISTEGHKFPFFFSFPTAVYFGYIDFPSRYVRWFRLACANFWRDPNEMIRFLSRPHTHTCPCSWEIDNNKRTTFKHHVFFFCARLSPCQSPFSCVQRGMTWIQYIARLPSFLSKG
jgi:hypothetical protein